MTPRIASKSLLSLTLLSISPLASAQSLLSRFAGPDASSFLAFIIIIFMVVAIPLFYASRREQRRHALYIRFIENGQEVPKELLPHSTRGKTSSERELVRGVWLVSLAIGAGLALYISTADWRIAAWSLVLLFLGIASFINAVLLQRSEGSSRQMNDRE